MAAANDTRCDASVLHSELSTSVAPKQAPDDVSCYVAMATRTQVPNFGGQGSNHG